MKVVNEKGQFLPTHGHSTKAGRSPTYRSWESMVRRCTYEGDDHYSVYGGAGIKVCERWLNFENFLADMGLRPEGKTLDRYPDCKGNYEPGNCRWATPIEQSRNRKNTVMVTYNGEVVPLAQVAEEHGLPYARVWQRLKRGESLTIALRKS